MNPASQTIRHGRGIAVASLPVWISFHVRLRRLHSGMDITYQYPPELLNLLVDTIPLLCRSKDDVVLFLRGAGIPRKHLQDIEARVQANRKSITKYEMVRTVLQRINEDGDRRLRERREVLKRVVEFEDFSRCWPDDQLKAKGLVSEIGRVVNVKDSFTRMKQEREALRDEQRREHLAKAEAARKRKADLAKVRDELFALFGETDGQKRGLELEAALNRLFAVAGILVRESFRRVGEKGEGVLEQIDGVIELDGEVYLVEVKWLSTSVSIEDVSRHLVRVFTRGSCRGYFISVTEFTPAAIKACQDALAQKVVILGLLQEIVDLLEAEGDLTALLKKKVQSAMIDKKPFVRVRRRP